MLPMNDGLKHVVKAKELILAFLEMNDIENEALLSLAADNLQLAEDALIAAQKEG